MSNDRLKFSFMWQHQETGTWLDKRYTFAEVLNGEPYDDMSDQPLLRKYHHVATRQWTGLHDSQGDMIFEGDHVQWGEDVIETVVFDDGMFQTETSCMDSNGARNMTVVGNIFDA